MFADLSSEIWKLSLQQKREDNVSEEQTKISLVLKVLSRLGHDIYSSSSLIYESSAGIRDKKCREKSDIILKKNDVPYAVIEVKRIGTKFTEDMINQLRGYFSSLCYKYSTVHYAILTDGVQYWLYGDIDRDNLLDNEPFCKIEDITKLSDVELENLELFSGKTIQNLPSIKNSLRAKRAVEGVIENKDALLYNLIRSKVGAYIPDEDLDRAIDDILWSSTKQKVVYERGYNDGYSSCETKNISESTNDEVQDFGMYFDDDFYFGASKSDDFDLDNDISDIPLVDGSRGNIVVLNCFDAAGIKDTVDMYGKKGKLMWMRIDSEQYSEETYKGYLLRALDLFIDRYGKELVYETLKPNYSDNFELSRGLTDDITDKLSCMTSSTAYAGSKGITYKGNVSLMECLDFCVMVSRATNVDISFGYLVKL